MKKILLGLLTISIIAIWGCTQKTRCYEIVFSEFDLEIVWEAIILLHLSIEASG